MNTISWMKSVYNSNDNIHTTINRSKIQHPQSYIPLDRQFTPLPIYSSGFTKCIYNYDDIHKITSKIAYTLVYINNIKKSMSKLLKIVP